MKMRLKIAARNIFRHRGRTSVSLLMIAGAVIGLVLFNGFAANILGNMRRIVIDNQYGHIQVAQRAFFELSPGPRKDQFIPRPAELAAQIQKVDGVKSVAGRISFFGLISTGDITISAKGMGFDPSHETEFNSNLVIDQGHPLTPDSKLHVIIGAGLQKKLNVKVGSDVTVLAYTLDGVVNALELNVVGIFQTKNSEVDDNVFMLPLSSVQLLLDTDLVEVLAVRLQKTDDTDSIRANLQDSVLDKTYQAKTWFELSNFYRQTAAFFRTQNLVIQIILLSLVFLGILNTVGMSVYERTGEIGTVRALGEPDASVIHQFTLEGAMLGFVGAVIGAAGGLACTLFINAIKVTMEMPGTSTSIPIAIDIVPASYLEAILIVILASTAATWIPSIRASKMSIVDALRKNI